MSYEFLDVILVALDVQWTDLLTILQSHDEAYHIIPARVRGKAEVFNFPTLAKVAYKVVVEDSCTEKATTDVRLVGVSHKDTPEDLRLGKEIILS